LGAPRRPPGIAVALLLLLAWSFALRLWLATPGLDKDRFWDEQYGVENLWSLIVDGRPRPANGFHPGLSYLPQAALLGAADRLHRLTHQPRLAVFAPDQDLTALGYLLCRLLQVALGTLSLYLVYRIGRRLRSPRLGLAAALLLAAVPWHLRQSVVFKPDILLVAATLAAFLAALAAAERPTAGQLIRAGAVVGLALAAKFNAGPIAIPVAIAALAEGGWRDRRRWLALAQAGGAALAVLLLLTPYLLLEPGLYVRSFGRTLRDYSVKGVVHHSSHLGVLAGGGAALLSDDFYGPLLGSVGLLGLAGLALVAATPAWRSRRPPPDSRARRLAPLMITGYVAGYALLYAASTTNPSDHNWLPVAPFVALAAAWTAALAWGRIAPRLRRWQQAVLGAAAAAAAAAWLIQPANAYVYDTCVPSTQELARDYLRRHLEPLGMRVVAREEDEEANWYADPAIVEEARRLDQVSPEALDRADAEVFHAERLIGAGGAGSELYHRRIDRGAVEATRIGPRPFRARGGALVVVVHRWLGVGEPEELEAAPVVGAPGRVAANLPGGLRPGEVVSLAVELPPGTDFEALQDLLFQGQPLDFGFAKRDAGSPRYVSVRFAVPAGGGRVTLVLPASIPPSRDYVVQLQRWRPPSRPAG
jgi:Dolichyl-phosphate-mannose-protein mannosyltransferase